MERPRALSTRGASGPDAIIRGMSDEKPKHSAGRQVWALTALLFAAGLAAFLLISFGGESDMKYHAGFIADCIESRFFPVDFVYYFSVAALGLFRTDLTTILVASSLVLAVALAAKYLVTARCLLRWLGPQGEGERGAPRWAPLAALGLAVLFCLPLPGMNWYLGQFPPNQWHNSTNITVMPFAVLLFFASAAFLESGQRRWILPVTLFTVLNLLTKPSLFFCFAVVFPLLALLRHGPGRRFLLSCIPVVAGGVVFAGYYLLVFHNAFYRELMEAEDVSLAFGFLHPWRDYSASIPLSIVNSLLLPLLVFAAYPRLLLRDTRVRYAAAMLFVGLLIFSFVHETGDRAFHGNLIWQNITANYLLHLAVLAAFAQEKLRTRTYSRYDRLLIGLFVLEALVGVAYVVKIIVSGDYV